MQAVAATLSLVVAWLVRRFALAAGLVASIVPGLQDGTEHAAAPFQDRATGASIGDGLGAAALTFALAAGGLWRRRRRVPRVVEPPLNVLKAPTAA
jgi:hypothetical protein